VENPGLSNDNFPRLCVEGEGAVGGGAEGPVFDLAEELSVAACGHVVGLGVLCSSAAAVNFYFVFGREIYTAVDPCNVVVCKVFSYALFSLSTYFSRSRVQAVQSGRWSSNQ